MSDRAAGDLYGTWHVWASLADPGASPMRITVQVCPVCRALVTDEGAHLRWHEAMAIDAQPE